MNMKVRVNGFSIGQAEAEAEINDDRFLDWYTDAFDLEDRISKKSHFLITGRKGSGKSMFARYMQKKSESDDELFVRIIDNDEVDRINSISELSSEALSATNLFKWIIFVELARLISRSNGAPYTPEYKKLEQFLTTNSRITEINKYTPSAVAEELERGGKFHVLQQAFSQIKRHFSTQNRASINELIPALEEVIYELLRKEDQQRMRYFIFVDDIDYGLKLSQKKKLNRIQDLIVSLRSVNSNVLRGTNASVVILLRNDIKKALLGDERNLGKTFRSSSINLNWFSTSDEDIYETPLHKFIQKRFQTQIYSETGFENQGDLIEQFFDYDVENVFKKICRLTSYRPRDFIYFFRKWDAKSFSIPRTLSDFRKLVEGYTRDYYSEITEELSIEYSSEIRGIHKLLKRVYQECKGGTTFLKYAQLIELTNDIFGENREDIIRSLVNYTIITPYVNNWEIIYQEDNPSDAFDLESVTMNLHPAIYEYHKTIS